MQGKGTWRPSAGRKRVVALGAALAAAAALALPAGAGANVPFQDINSPGPISNIFVGNELSCQVKLTQDDVFSYYPPSTRPGDCGTFLQVEGDSTVFGPDFGNHDGTATGALPGDYEPWVPVSQTAVTGSGTPSNPLSVTTRVAAGTAPNLFVRETYTYVIGSRSYGVKIEVINNNPLARTVRLYHAVDCYLAGSDYGFGFFVASPEAIFCSESPNNSPAGRLLGFGSSTPFNYIESYYGTVWAKTDGTNYPNTVEPDTNQDNGIGVQFNLTVPGGGTNEISTVDLSSTVDSGDVLETQITKGPKKKTKKKKATFEFAALLGGVPITNATFTCTVNSKPPVACTSPFKTKGKKGKKNTFSVQATANGETDSTPAAQSWKIKKKKKKH
ncbi:MAG TPA: hypothetical protein VEK39_11710 [Solirubrobacterales bacterium]|nr:hypothetical protein [Solirubrobacterales bacterium]